MLSRSVLGSRSLITLAQNVQARLGRGGHEEITRAASGNDLLAGRHRSQLEAEGR